MASTYALIPDSLAESPSEFGPPTLGVDYAAPAVLGCAASVTDCAASVTDGAASVADCAAGPPLRLVAPPL